MTAMIIPGNKYLATIAQPVLAIGVTRAAKHNERKIVPFGKGVEPGSGVLYA